MSPKNGEALILRSEATKDLPVGSGPRRNPRFLTDVVGLALAGMVIVGCTMTGGAPDLSGLLGPQLGDSSGAPPAQQRRTRTQPAPEALSAPELYGLYQAILDTYVDRVEPAVLVTGALGGAHQGSVEGGLLPVESAIFDTAPLRFSGDRNQDWRQLANPYDAFLRKLRPRFDVSPIGRAAARGMLEALADPNAVYLPQTAAQAQRTSQYAGIGVVLAGSLFEGHPVVREVVPGGPAERAGIRVGDAILAVGNRATESMTLGASVAAIRGAEGTTVPLTLRRPGEQASHEVQVQRGMVQLSPLAMEVRAGIGYLRLRAFEDGISEAARRALMESASAGVHGWVIDLRGADGGSFQEAVNLASFFVGPQTITLQEDRQRRRTPVPGDTIPMDASLPAALIVDETTGGAAEVFAAALHDYKAAVVVGERTAGKAALTTAFALSDGSVAQITSQRLLSPSGVQLHRVGLSPDEVVIEHMEDWVAGRDPQLDRAIAALTEAA